VETTCRPHFSDKFTFCLNLISADGPIQRKQVREGCPKRSIERHNLIAKDFTSIGFLWWRGQGERPEFCRWLTQPIVPDFTFRVFLLILSAAVLKFHASSVRSKPSAVAWISFTFLHQMFASIRFLWLAYPVRKMSTTLRERCIAARQRRRRSNFSYVFSVGFVCIRCLYVRLLPSSAVVVYFLLIHLV
jgi:hypothetical protein